MSAVQAIDYTKNRQTPATLMTAPRTSRAVTFWWNTFLPNIQYIHWRNIDENVSFESFLYDEQEPALMYVG